MSGLTEVMHVVESPLLEVLTLISNSYVIEDRGSNWKEGPAASEMIDAFVGIVVPAPVQRGGLQLMQVVTNGNTPMMKGVGSQ